MCRGKGKIFLMRRAYLCTKENNGISAVGSTGKDVVMKSKFDRIIAFALSMILCVSGSSIPVYAEEDETPEQIEFVSEFAPAPNEEKYESVNNDPDSDRFFGAEDSFYISDVATSIPSRDQDPYGTCWAFATMAAAEMSAVKNGTLLRNKETADSSIDLSELHLAYFSGVDNEPYDPLGGFAGDRNGVPRNNFLNNGGNPANAVNLLANWIGTADENDYKYANDDSLKSFSTDSVNGTDDVMHMRGFYYANPKSDRDAVKKLIKDYGAVTAAYNDVHKDDSMFADAYSRENNCYYMPIQSDTSHVVSIIGWNDDFPKENFAYSEKPEGDGAWLIRNSWEEGNRVEKDGTITGNNAKYRSYFWMSYYDRSLWTSCFALDMDSVDKYDHNYQYDGCMTGGIIGGYEKYASVFTASSDAPQLLKAVYFATHSANVSYKIDVYAGVSPDDPESGRHLTDGQEGVTDYAGGHTIELDSPVMINPEEQFSVVLTVPQNTQMDIEGTYNNGGTKTNAHTEGSRSVCLAGGEWKTGNQAVNKSHLGDFRIKAFTSNVSSNSVSVTGVTLPEKETLEIGSSITLTPVIEPSDATDQRVSWKSSDESVAVVDQNGLVKAVASGTADITVTTTDGNYTAKCKVTVKGDQPEDKDNIELTLNGTSDYNSVRVWVYDGTKPVKGANVGKGEKLEFQAGNRIVITGLGEMKGAQKGTTYFVRVSADKETYYGDNIWDEKQQLFDLGPVNEDLDIKVEGRRLATTAITASGRIRGAYGVTTNVAEKKGGYVDMGKKNESGAKTTFAVKKTGSLNYTIGSDAATMSCADKESQEINLSGNTNKYYEIPFEDLAKAAFMDSPSISFTLNVVTKFPVPTVKVASSTDLNATLDLKKPKAAADIDNLWYRIEAKANVANNKTLPEGMAETVGPLYVPASVTSLTVDLTAKEGMKPGDGAAQKYDFKVTLLQLENEPEYTDKPLTDKTVVEGADGGNVVGVSPEKKVSGSTKKPGYEEKLGLTKKQNSFICGEGGDDGVLLATAKYSKNTTFKSLAYAKITNSSGETVRASDTEDDFKKILIDGDDIILEDTSLAPGKYKLSVLPVSKVGSPLPKAATLALTVKQGIDELTVSVPQQSYVKKAKKALTIKPTVTYNGGEKTKKPANTKLNWEVLDADGNALTADSPLYGKVTVNQKNGTVTVAKDLVVSGDASAYRFMIMATAADYADNMASAKSDVIKLVADGVYSDFPPVELEISIDDRKGNGHIKASDVNFTRGTIRESDGKLYVNGDILLFKIGSVTKDNEIHVYFRIEDEIRDAAYGPGHNNWGKDIYDLDSNVPLKAMEMGKKLLMTVVVYK